MHIRVNIPRWGWAEHFNGIRSLFSTDPESYSKELLTEIKAFSGGKNIYLVSSATYGLMLAIRHLKLEGKRIAVPGYVCQDVLTAIYCTGSKPVSIDISPNSIRFDMNKLAEAVKKNQIDGILAANSYGLDQDYESLGQFGKPIIEDAAYQAGKSTNPHGQPCGLRADAGVWSFNFKALTSAGGGVLFTSDELTCPFPAEARRTDFRGLKLYINRAIRSILTSHIPKFLPGATAPQLDEECESRQTTPKVNEEPMSNLQAAIALAQWKNRKNLYGFQQKNVMQLREVVSQCALVKMLSANNEVLVHILPLILGVQRDKVRAAKHRFRQILHSYSVQTKPRYPILLRTPEEIPNSYELADRILLIPCNASLGSKQIALIGKAIHIASEIIFKEFGGLH